MLFTVSTAIEFGDPPGAADGEPGTPIGNARLIFRTSVLLVVSITEMLSLKALATNRYWPHKAMPVGCKPLNVMVLFSVQEGRSTTEMVAVEMEPVGYATTTGVPLEYPWKSFCVAIRPASLEM